MSDVPDDLLYSKDHEWVLIKGSIATVGITDYAQDQLGDLTYIELPDVGDSLEQFAEAGVVESVKTASDLYTPVAGTVTAVNADLRGHPERINQDPYGKGWIFKIELDEAPPAGSLLDAAGYEELISEEHE